MATRNLSYLKGKKSRLAFAALFVDLPFHNSQLFGLIKMTFTIYLVAVLELAASMVWASPPPSHTTKAWRDGKEKCDRATHNRKTSFEIKPPKNSSSHSTKQNDKCGLQNRDSVCFSPTSSSARGSNVHSSRSRSWNFSKSFKNMVKLRTHGKENTDRSYRLGDDYPCGRSNCAGKRKYFQRWSLRTGHRLWQSKKDTF